MLKPRYANRYHVTCGSKECIYALLHTTQARQRRGDGIKNAWARGAFAYRKPTRPAINRVGQQIGRLTVLRRVENKNNRVMWECLCKCGNIIVVASGQLGAKRSTKSCGCIKIEQITRNQYGLRHGYRPKGKWHYLYKTWQSMKERCLNPNNRSYSRYGGRGICIYSEWMDFVPFKDYVINNMGERPSGHSLDRIDNDGNYEPDNIRWATISQQNNNRGQSSKMNHGT